MLHMIIRVSTFRCRFHRLKHGPCTFQFEGTGGSLAHAFPPEDGVAHFDDDEVFTDGTSAGINLFSVALHEIGHLLGLRHSQNTSAIMYKTYKAYDPSMTLTSEERDGIEYIYGKRPFIFFACPPALIRVIFQ